jgi:hypothetical protein
VRRVVLILLALVLVPSTAMASWYQCAYDGVTRSACCCPTNTHQQKTPAQDTSVRAACCCTITRFTSTAPTVRANQPMSVDVAPVALVVVFTLAPPRTVGGMVSIDRPRAQGDPPDTLFARRCSLLL